MSVVKIIYTDYILQWWKLLGCLKAHVGGPKKCDRTVENI